MERGPISKIWHHVLAIFPRYVTGYGSHAPAYACFGRLCMRTRTKHAAGYVNLPPLKSTDFGVFACLARLATPNAVGVTHALYAIFRLIRHTYAQKFKKSLVLAPLCPTFQGSLRSLYRGETTVVGKRYVTVINRNYRSHPNRYQANHVLPFPSKSLPTKSCYPIPIQTITVQKSPYLWFLFTTQPNTAQMYSSKLPYSSTSKTNYRRRLDSI